MLGPSSIPAPTRRAAQPAAPRKTPQAKRQHGQAARTPKSAKPAKTRTPPSAGAFPGVAGQRMSQQIDEMTREMSPGRELGAGWSAGAGLWICGFLRSWSGRGALLPIPGATRWDRERRSRRESALSRGGQMTLAGGGAKFRTCEVVGEGV